MTDLTHSRLLRIAVPIVISNATVPLLGMSWFFDTEKWASIGRDRWAAMHADTWRMAMVSAANEGPDASLEVNIPGLDSGSFSFIVVGDTGEGGLSQRALAREIVETTRRGDVRFVLVSSDVVYPNGEMKDYEERFWSPFSGISVPIVAIPGNHDWYDGLDSFAATFFTPEAARAVLARALRHAGTVPVIVETIAEVKAQNLAIARIVELVRQLNTLLDKNAAHVRVLRETLDNLAQDRKSHV